MMESPTFHIRFQMILRALVLLGSLLWGWMAFSKVNPLQFIAKKMSIPGAEKSVYLLVAFAAVVLLFSRDYHLPFLGPAAYPCGSLLERIPDGADTRATVHVRPGAHVIFWAAEGPRGSVQETPWIAYQKAANAGVVRADPVTGAAVLQVRAPAAYRVPVRGQLAPHIHYRVCALSGMLGPVQTVYLDLSRAGAAVPAAGSVLAVPSAK